MRSAYIKFSKSEVTGSDGCNGFGGPARIASDHVTFGQLAMTEIGCLGNGPWATFDAVLGVGSANWSITGDVLTLSNAKGTLTFRPETPTPPAALLGTLWSLTTIGDNNVASTVTGTTTLSLTTDGRYVISHACYEVRGVATSTGQRLTLGGASRWEHSCPFEAGGPDDARADHILSGTVTWSIQGTNLTITKPGVGFVSFAQVPTPAPSATAQTR
jgi:heat shock protein HslJ